MPTCHLQIGHAGDGGLYAELVQDRSFDALARVSGFGGGVGGSAGPPPSQQRPQRLPVDLAALAAQHHDGARPLYRSKADFLRSRQRAGSRWVGSRGQGVGVAGHLWLLCITARSSPLEAHKLIVGLHCGRRRASKEVEIAASLSSTLYLPQPLPAQHPASNLIPLPKKHPMLTSPTALMPFYALNCSSSSSNDIIVAWRGVGSVSTALTREHPLNEHNTVAMSLTSNGLGGLACGWGWRVRGVGGTGRYKWLPNRPQPGFPGSRCSRLHAACRPQ